MLRPSNVVRNGVATAYFAKEPARFCVHIMGSCFLYSHAAVKGRATDLSLARTPCAPCVCVYSHHLDLYLGGLVPLPEAHRSLWPKSPKTNCVVLFRWYVETSRYIADNPVNKIDWIGSDSYKHYIYQ